ncbi:MAG: hypothetical protein ACYTEQ_23920, partial [Planctomycetota bacterium]
MPFTRSEIARWLRNLNVEADVREAIRAIATPTGSITGTIAYLEADTANWAAGSAVLHIQTDDDDAIPLKVHNGTGVTFQVDRDGSVTLSGIAIGDDGQLVFGDSSDVAFEYDTGQTVDAMLLGVCAVSRNLIICEKADMGTDFTHAQSTDPRLYIQSADATTVADNVQIYHDQTNGNIASGAGNLVLTPAGGGVSLGDDIELQLGATPDNALIHDTGQTVNALIMGLSTVSRNLVVCEYADIATDWTHAQSTNPTVYIQSSDATTVADYLALYHDQTDANVASGAGNIVLTPAGGGVSLADDIELQLGSTPDNALVHDTGQTVNALILGLSATSRNLVICEYADIATDWTHAQSTDPRLYIQSSDATTVADNVQIFHDQTDGNIATGGGDLILTPAGGGITLAGAVSIGDDLELMFGGTPDAAIEYDTGQTVNALILGLSTASRNLIICEYADIATDWTHAQSTDPRLYIQSSDATTVADNLQLYHDQTNANIASGAGNIVLTPAGGAVSVGDDVQIQMGATPDNAFEYDTGETVNALKLGLSTASRNLVICEYADIATNFTHAQSTNPTVYIQSADATTVADFLALYHDQTDAVVASGAGNVKIDPASTICEIDGSLNLATSLNFSAAGSITTGTNQDLTFLPGGTGITIIGNAGTPNRLPTPTNDDFFITGRGECNGVFSHDGTVYMYQGLSISAGTVTITPGATFGNTTRCNTDVAMVMGSAGISSGFKWTSAQTPDTLCLLLDTSTR